MKRLIKAMLYGFVLFLCAIFVFRSIYSAGLVQEPKKSGTDAAGYAILAKQIREDRLLNRLTASPRPSELEAIAIQAARDGKEIHSEWETGLAPNSFRYNLKLSRNVSQYPLGTSYLMSFFPSQVEVRALLIACIGGSTLIFSYLILNAYQTPFGLKALILISWLICTWLCRAYLGHSFSMYPTVVLALMCGLVSMKAGGLGELSSTATSSSTKSPKTAVILGLMLGLSLWFRTSNILLGIPIVTSLLFCPESDYSVGRKKRQSGITERLRSLWRHKRLLLSRLAAVSTGFGIGLTPLLASNYIISRNILFSNYPSYDRAYSTSVWSIYGNLETLFLRSGSDSLLLVLAVVVLLVCEVRSTSIGSKHASEYWKLSIVVFFCSALLISLKVVIASYYVSCVAFFYLAHGLTWLISSLDGRKKKRSVVCVASGIVFAVGIVTVSPYLPSISVIRDTPSEEEHSLLMKSLGSENTVVWSDEESGYLYYNYGILGLRHTRMSSQLSTSIMCNLVNRGYKQYLEGSIDQRRFPGDYKLYSFGKPISVGTAVVREIMPTDKLCPG